MFCPQCGAPNEEDAIFCGNCGAVLDAEGAAAEAASEAPLEVAAEEPGWEAVEELPEEVVEEAVAPAGLAEELAVEPLPPPPPLPPAPPAPPRAYQAAAQTSGMAVASLVMGIAGWTLLPLLGSILAIVFGYAARREIRQRPDQVSGEGLAVAGLVLGWLMVGLTVVGLCLGGLALCFLIPAYSGVSY